MEHYSYPRPIYKPKLKFAPINAKRPAPKGKWRWRPFWIGRATGPSPSFGLVLYVPRRMFGFVFYTYLGNPVKYV